MRALEDQEAPLSQLRPEDAQKIFINFLDESMNDIVELSVVDWYAVARGYSCNSTRSMSKKVSLCYETASPVRSMSSEF